MHYSSARAFMRREDYQPETTPADSPFRQFKVSCLKCGSFKLKLVSHYDEDSGETGVSLLCTNCPNREKMPIRG